MGQWVTHTQPFYGSVEFVRENPGEPVPEETFTHYPIVVINHPYQPPPSSTIYGILPIQWGQWVMLSILNIWGP